MIYASTQFQNKVIMVTGAGSGIGRETCVLFSSLGAYVAIVDNHEEKGLETHELLKKESRRSLYFQCDVSNEKQVAKVVHDITSYFGRLDYAYNNAGIGGSFGNVETYPVDDWDLVMNINLKGVFLCMKYQVPAMMKVGKGAIVNCASVLSTVAYAEDTAYVVSKFGVLGLTKNAALDYANTPIRINAVSPGFTYTPMIMKGNAEKIKQLETKHPAGRLANPREIANGVAWLCSDEASFVIGHNLIVDGGYTLV